jgi:hypothetical protein
MLAKRGSYPKLSDLESYLTYYNFERAHPGRPNTGRPRSDLVCGARMKRPRSAANVAGSRVPFALGRALGMCHILFRPVRAAGHLLSLDDLGLEFF